MDTLKNVFGANEEQRRTKSKIRSPDGSSVDEDSPMTDYVTLRKNPRTDIQDLRNDFQTFQSRIMAKLESWFTKQEEKFEEIKASIKFMNEYFEDLKCKTEDVARRLNELEIKQSTESKKLSCLDELEVKIDMMEQQARMTNMEISNLPERRGENLLMILENIASMVNIPVSKQDIVSIHRVPHATTDNTRPKNVIVKFGNRMLRDNMFSAIRLKKDIDSVKLGISGPKHNIYANEHLTLKNKSLFRETREAARKCGYRFVWVKHGTILVREKETSPVFAVRSKGNLSKIKANC
ncbi:uncharacterized protein LOC123722422 [Papilio machaon]|uniref:uncharacterized protein LOC123722422 n=1 Tax=Papilio machaon TaxID=76193 RepID=UPI001E6633A1|nr:uncharacterized protein LOC123722422 [Papilio machaon]